MNNPQETHDALVSELCDDADMVELVEMFVEELPGRIAVMEEALREQDISELARAAHQLKGAAGGYGFPTITDAARHLEHTLKATDDIEKLTEEVKAIAELCGRARAT